MKQITTPFDRFYENHDLINTRTGNNFFPSVTHVLNHDQTSPQLIKWYKNLGHYADDFVNHRANIGSLVHNLVELMVKHDEPVTEEVIKDYYKTSTGLYLGDTDMLFVKRSLAGFIKWHEFMKAEYDDFEILSCEFQTCGEDYAGTVDLKIFYDGKTAIVDLKTSKDIRIGHEMQVEAYRRSDGSELGCTLKLGSERRNSTNYKFGAVKTKAKQDRLWKRFCLIKDLYYMDNPDASPTFEDFPYEFLITK